MAQQVRKEDRVEMRHSPGRARYDWENWTNGEQWMITEGVDFFVSPESMVGNIHSAARRIRDEEGRRTTRANTTTAVLEKGKHKGKTRIWFEFVEMTDEEKRHAAEVDARHAAEAEVRQKKS